MSSQNREPNTSISNPTNEITINPNLSQTRMSANAIEMVSAEIPLTQRIIEDEWSRVYISQGLPLYTNNNNYISVKSAVNEYKIYTPLVYNPIQNVDTTDPTSPIFTTLYDHMLDLSGEWSWGDSIRVISTRWLTSININDPRTGTLLGNVDVLSPTTFQISGLSVPLVPLTTSNIRGYLLFPVVPTPSYMANILNASSTDIRVSYNKLTSRFSINTSMTDALLLCTPLSVELGFQPFAVRFSSQNTPGMVTAINDWAAMGYITLSPGDYDVDSFETELNYRANPLYFPDDETQRQLTLTKENGLLITIVLRAGLYTPDGLANTLTSLFFQTSPTIENIKITWNVVTSRFTIESITGTPFGIQFNDPLSLAHRLGFPRINVTNRTSYESNVVTIPSYVHNGVRRYFNDVYTFKLDKTTLKTTFTAIPQESVVVVPVLYGDKYLVDNNYHSYGMQVNDLVDVSTQDLAYELKVTDVYDTYFTLEQAGIELAVNEIDIAGVVINDLLDGTIVLITIADNDHTFKISHLAQVNDSIGIVLLVQPTFMVVNFALSQFNKIAFDSTLFTLPHTDTVTLSNVFVLRKNTLIVTNLLLAPKLNSIKPISLGFNQEDYMWNPQSYSIISPLTYCLQKPQYVLIEMTNPIGSTWTEHRHIASLKSTILAKVTLVDHPWLDIKYPRKIHFFGGIKLGSVNLRILNPDHTLYKLHGHDWFGTFRIEVGE